MVAFEASQRGNQVLAFGSLALLRLDDASSAEGASTCRVKRGQTCALFKRCFSATRTG